MFCSLLNIEFIVLRGLRDEKKKREQERKLINTEVALSKSSTSNPRAGDNTESCSP